MKSLIVSKIIKSTVIVTLALLAIKIGIDYKSNQNSKKTEVVLLHQKQELLNDLAEFKKTIESVMAENSLMKKEFAAERQKVIVLEKEISKSDINLDKSIKYSQQVRNLQQVIVALKLERDKLKQQNSQLTIQRDSSNLLLTKAKDQINTLDQINIDLNKSIKKTNTFKIINIQVNAFKQTHGKMKATTKARKVNLLQVEFMISCTKNEKVVEKDYYIQIIDEQNRIISDFKTEKFKSQQLDYNHHVKVEIKNEIIDVMTHVALQNIEKGNYWVNLFDKCELVSKTNFELF